ncbi:MAG: carbamoyltransferase [Gammaproteobacteria bacterium]|nr:carbamoyltransferase [Gammaproteobacteria bacterium]
MIDGQFVVLSLYEVHMASASIMIDGHVVAASHEERFTRLKNDCGFPLSAALFCMEEAGVKPSQVDKVAFVNKGFPPASVANILFKRMAIFSREDWIRENEIYWKPKLIENKAVTNYFDLMGGWERVSKNHNYDLSDLDMYGSDDVIIRQFNEIRKDAVSRHLGIDSSKVRFLPHYFCHHYHAYYSSPYRGDDVVVLHAEGAGEDYNQAVSVPSKSGLKLLAGTNQCDIGRLYQWMTLLLGMKPYQHEYKLMGLAPQANIYEVARSKKVFDGLFKLSKNKMYIEYSQKPKDLYYHFRDALEGHRFDGIAGALQQMVEDRLVEWVNSVVDLTGKRTVVYGGGVAMNVKANMKIGAECGLEKLFVPIAPSDESNVLGAGYWLTEKWFLENGKNPEEIPPLSSPYLGKDLERSEIEKVALAFHQDGYEVVDVRDVEQVVTILKNGKILARCQGRSEFGQRALGNRSILANVKTDGMVEKINHQIKHRDFWMPFAASFIKERVSEYLINPKKHESPYMTMALEVRASKRKELINGIHAADGTTRPQILERSLNNKYYSLIEALSNNTGTGAILNTSFNLHGEPIVECATDAERVFRNTELDALWLGDKLVSRKISDSE